MRKDVRQIGAAVTKLAVDFRYFETRYELWALSHMLEVIEPAIETLSNADLNSTLDEIHHNGWEPGEGDAQIALQEVIEKSEYVLPRFMRGPFVVSLWACLETGVQSVAARHAGKTGAPIKMNELRGDGFLKRAARYFDAILGLPLELDEKRYRRLADLYTIRCSLAHANGLRAGMSDQKWTELCNAMTRQNLIPNERDMVVLSHDYVAQSYEDVRGCLSDLLDRAIQQEASS